MGGKRWTEDELAYLEKYYGRRSNEALAKKLGRSIRSVILKTNRLGFGHKIAFDGLITLCQIYAYTHGRRGMRSCTYKRWTTSMEQENVKIYKFHLSTRYPEKVTEMVEIEDFWRWAEKHPKFILMDKLEEGALGPEPMWLINRRRTLWEERRRARWKNV